MSRDRWRLTAAGVAALRVSQELGVVGDVLRSRTDASPEGMNAFELIQGLRKEGWAFDVFVKMQRGHAPPPFTGGQDKIVWARPGDKRWSVAYLRALLESPQHAQEVPHFQPDRFYLCLIEGVPFVKRSRRKKGPFFQFGTEENMGVGVKLPDSVVAPAPAAADSDGSAEGSESTSSSSCAASSSSGADSESEGSSEDVAPAPKKQAIPQADTAGSEEEEKPRLHPCAAQVWKGFRFTPIFIRTCPGETRGWEVTCCAPQHRDSTLCRRRRLFSTNGGASKTERALKQWCLSAADYPSRIAHRDAPEVSIDELPSLQSLEDSDVRGSEPKAQMPKRARVR